MPRPRKQEAVCPEEEFVAWSEVEKFLCMAEQALKVRTQAAEALSQELESARTEKTKVELTSSAAQEESSFLADHLQSLLDERAALREGLERAQRDREYLLQENGLLRQELLEGAALGEEGGAALQLLARQAEALRAEQQRNARLENDNVQLQARVSALERANTAQNTAMLSCLEDSERVRLQQLSLAPPPHLSGGKRGGGGSDSGDESPLGPLSRCYAATDDTASDGACYAEGLSLGLVGDLASEASCATPLGPNGSSSKGGGDASGGGGGRRAMFRGGGGGGSQDASPVQQLQLREGGGTGGKRQQARR